MAFINESKRSGKAAFYRAGFRFGFEHGTGRTPWADIGAHRWPDWARDAYRVGLFDGQYQRQIARCMHEPMEHRDRREVPRCVHCGMSMRALRRRPA